MLSSQLSCETGIHPFKKARRRARATRERIRRQSLKSESKIHYLFPFEPAKYGAGRDFFGVQVKIALRNVL